MGFTGLPAQMRAKLKNIAKREGCGPFRQLKYTEAMRIADAERAIRTWMDAQDVEDMRRRRPSRASTHEVLTLTQTIALPLPLPLS